MSPGCTNQACTFRDLYPQFREKGAVVLGVNADSVESHKRFEEEHGLPFPLLSDPEKTMLQAYDVRKERLMFGKPVMGIERSTYLIDENGLVAKAFGKVKPKDNAKQMLKEIEEFQNNEKQPRRSKAFPWASFSTCPDSFSINVLFIVCTKNSRIT